MTPCMHTKERRSPQYIDAAETKCMTIWMSEARIRRQGKQRQKRKQLLHFDDLRHDAYHADQRLSPVCACSVSPRSSLQAGFSCGRPSAGLLMAKSRRRRLQSWGSCSRSLRNLLSVHARQAVPRRQHPRGYGLCLRGVAFCGARSSSLL